MEKITKNEIVKKIKELGYIVSITDERAIIKEPFTSDVTGKKELNIIAESTSCKPNLEHKIIFLKEVFDDLVKLSK